MVRWPPICSRPFLSPLESAAPEILGKTFSQVVVNFDDSQVTQLPPRTMIGDKVKIKITQEEYEAEFRDCSTHLHGRVVVQQSDTPLTTQILKLKLTNFWSGISIGEWSVTPLERGCFEFKFNIVDDMRKVLAQGVINLKPG